MYAFRLMGATKLSAGQRVRAGDLDLTVIHTPGHTSDHVAFFEPGSGALFTGDTVLGRGTSFIDPPDGDLVQYLRSLRRLMDLGARSIPGSRPCRAPRSRQAGRVPRAPRRAGSADRVGARRRPANDRRDGRGDLRGHPEGGAPSRGAVGAGASREAGPRGASGTDRQGRRGDLDGLDAENASAAGAGSREGPLLRFMHPCDAAVRR